MQSRIIVRTVTVGGTFDGVTPELTGAASGYEPAVSSAAKSYKVAATDVGRFGIGALGRKGNGMALVRVRVYDQINPGDRIEVRSGTSADAGNDSLAISSSLAPADELLATYPLGNEFGDWILLGPTDALAVYHDLTVAPREDTLEILVLEGEAWELLELIACCSTTAADNCCSGEAIEVTITEEDEGGVGLLPFTAGTLYVTARSQVPGGVLTIPTQASLNENAQVLVRRASGSEWFTIVSANGINGVNAPDGVIMSADDDAVLLKLNKSQGWYATKEIPDLAPATVTTAIAAFSDWAVRRIAATEAGPLTLPALASVAQKQLLVVTNDTDGAGATHEVTVLPVTGELIDGIANKAIVLTNPGDTLFLLVDGGATRSWRSVDNLFGREKRLSESSDNPVTFTTGWRGTRTHRSTLNGNQVVNLPPSNVTPVGCRLHAYSTQTQVAAITFAAQGTDVIVGNGTSAVSASIAGPFEWGFLEYEGGGVWSFHE